MAKIRRQIISPHVRFAASSRGPYANRLGGGSYAKTFNIGACFRVVSVSVGDPSSDWFTVCFNDTPDQTGCLTQDFTFRNETRAIDMPTTQAIPGTGDCLQYESGISSENPSSGPGDVLTMDYDDAQAAGGPCKLDGSTAPDCELATIVNFPVTNNIFGPIDSEMGDVSNTTLVATFPADVAQTGSTTLTWEVFYDLVPQTINSAVIVNNNEVHFTMAAFPNDTASITFSHTRNDGVNACQAVDGRYCWRFEQAAVGNNVDTTSPTIPVGLSATATGQTTIDLSWNASTDDKSGMKEYVVYRASVEIDRVAHPTTTYQDTGLSPETPYSYTVSAVDNKNNESAESTGDSATTWAPAPNVSAAEVGNVADNIIVVTFDREVVATDYTQGWSFTEDASPVTISSANKTQATEVQFTLSADISDGTTVAYNYSAASGNYENTDGVDMENQSGSVTNNVSPPVTGPEFQAFAADTNGVIKALNIGSGSVTFGRATAATVRTAPDSLIKIAKVNEIRYQDARRGENLCTGLVTETITVVNGNDYQLTIAGDNGATAVCSGAFTGTLTANGVNRISWNNGTPQTAGSTSLTITVTGTLTEMFLEDVTGDTNQNPGEYIPAGEADGTAFAYAGGVRYYNYQKANTVSGTGIVTEAKGSDLTTDWGALFEPAATNLTRSSEALSNTSHWANQAGTLTRTADDTAAPDGTITADKLDTTSNAQVTNARQQVAIADDSESYVFSIFIKKTSGDSHYAAISPEFTGGTNRTACSAILNTNDGTISAQQIFVDDAGVETYGTDWYRFWVKVSNNGTGNTNMDVRLYPAYNTDGTATQDAAATGFKHFWGAMLEKTDVISSYVPTAGATETRSADDGAPMFDYANWSQTEGTLVFKLSMAAAINQGIFNVANAEAGVISYDTTNQFQTDDGTNQANVDPSLSSNLNDVIAFAVDYKTNLYIGYKNITDAGSWVWDTDSASFDGAFFTNSVINLFYDVAAPSVIRDLDYYQTQQGKTFIEANY